MDKGQRPRFCAQLDGNIGRIIFSHLHQFLTRAICRAVCRAWRALIGLGWIPLGREALEQYVREARDEHMGCLVLWRPRLVHWLDFQQYRQFVLDTIRYDRPMALRMALAYAPYGDQKRSLDEAIEVAVACGSRAVIEQALMPAAVLAGRQRACFLRILTHGSLALFEWYWSQAKLPVWPDFDARGIHMGGIAQVPALDAKICYMRDSGWWTRIWWVSWFTVAAGVRGSWTNTSGKHFYHDYNREQDEASYNADVAVAIVEHVLHSIPQPALEYLCNQKVRITRARDDALMARLARWRPAGAGAGGGEVAERGKRLIPGYNDGTGTLLRGTKKPRVAAVARMRTGTLLTSDPPQFIPDYDGGNGDDEIDDL